MKMKLNFFGYIDCGMITGVAVSNNGGSSKIIDIEKGTIDVNRFKDYIDNHASMREAVLNEFKGIVFNKEYKKGFVCNVFLVDLEGNMYWGTRKTETLKKIEIKMIDFYIGIGKEEKI
jgi:hypothetical protein